MNLRERIALLLGTGKRPSEIASILEIPVGSVRYHRKVIAGKCPQCGASLRRDRVLCRKCQAPNSQWSNGRIHRRRSEGLCYRCGKRKPTPGANTCSQCRTRATKQRQDAVARWSVNGLCVACGAERLPGRKQCLRCLGKNKRHVS